MVADIVPLIAPCGTLFLQVLILIAGAVAAIALFTGFTAMCLYVTYEGACFGVYYLKQIKLLLQGKIRIVKNY